MCRIKNQAEKIAGKIAGKTVKALVCLPAFFAVKIIRFYQKHISVCFPARCRYFPTCSSYCLQAIRRFGVFKGGILSIFRLLRCNPFSDGGTDDVPEKFEVFRLNKNHKKNPEKKNPEEIAKN
ncbi:MAG: membrane protein insertion efficiency factor YidD [Bifidobacteriaceae bacterium]|nr:membrane protein insertion efficiency factor YidD [Bifidobacteriaceae bacterium]MEE0940484.1 membrane protein insertion efficiency factor YidD [Bifidobacteriaceae bacterium]